MRKIILIALALVLALSQEAVLAQTQKGVSQKFANTMAAGKYTMKFRNEQKIADQTITFEATQYVSGDKSALIGKQGDHSVRIIVRDGKAYMIDETSKKIFAMPDVNAAKDMGVNVSNFSAVGYGHETFMGKNLPYDEYATDKGKVRMYVNNGILVGFKALIKDDFPVIIEITDFADRVDEKVFNLPTGYTMVGL